MDDLYPINVAKTHFQEAWNTGDVDRLLSVVSEGFLDFSDERPTSSRAAARLNLKRRFEQMQTAYDVRLDVIIISIQIVGSMAVDLGWEEWKLSPKDGSPRIDVRKRYLETWRRETDGQWRIAAFISNQDVPDRMTG